MDDLHTRIVSFEEFPEVSAGCRLPTGPLIPVAPSSAQPETLVFTKYLTSLTRVWRLGSNYTISWPACVAMDSARASQDGYMLG